MQAAGQFDLLATQNQSDHSETPTQFTSPKSHEHPGCSNHLEPSEAQYPYETPEEQFYVDASEEQSHVDASEEQSHVDASEEQICIEPLQAQENYEPRQKRRKYVELPRNPCRDCGALVPYTNAAIQRHIRDHHPTIVDLNHVSIFGDLDAIASSDSLEDWKYFATLAEQEEAIMDPMRRYSMEMMTVVMKMRMVMLKITSSKKRQEDQRIGTSKNKTPASI